MTKTRMRRAAVTEGIPALFALFISSLSRAFAYRHK